MRLRAQHEDETDEGEHREPIPDESPRQRHPPRPTWCAKRSGRIARGPRRAERRRNCRRSRTGCAPGRSRSRTCRTSNATSPASDATVASGACRGFCGPMLEALGATPSAHPLAAKARAVIENWDGNRYANAVSTTREAGGVIFSIWLDLLLPAVF